MQKAYKAPFSELIMAAMRVIVALPPFLFWQGFVFVMFFIAFMIDNLRKIW